MKKDKQMARRKDHTREELKDMIVDAAWDIIDKSGPTALSARNIATIIGYAPGTIYNIFASMDDLSLHVNARTLDLMQAELLSDMPADLEKTQFVPAAVMKKMAKRYIEFARKYRPYWLMLFENTAGTEDQYVEWYGAKVEIMFAPLERLLQPYFDKNDSKGLKQAARVLWGSVHGLCFLQETGKIVNAARNGLNDEKDPALALAHNLIETYMAGISAGR